MAKVSKVSEVVEQYSSDEDSSGVSDGGLSPSEGSSGSEQQGSDSEESGSDSEESGSEDEETQQQSEAARLRERLANVPFDQLIRIQQQMGTRKFNEKIGLEDKAQARARARRALEQQRRGIPASGDRELGQSRRGIPASRDQDSDDSGSGDSDSDDSGPEAVSAKPSGSWAAQGKLRRDSKKMPTMMSSKRAVGRFRQVVDMPAAKTRDPRFDSLSGHFNEDLFEKSYGFLDEQRRQEMGDLRRRAKELRDSNPNQAQRIQRALGTMQSQEAARQQKKRTQELKRKHRRLETEAVRQGKKPYFLGRRELREMDAAQKFNKLKDSSKLDRFLEKRRKRNASKDHRRMPSERRDD
ncbi:rRNA biogenesis protein rrp36 [Coemansia sp. RSA 552]|nr:rRNA biogenesis protein rrp36 [Coemansia sp. RSA 552]